MKVIDIRHSVDFGTEGALTLFMKIFGSHVIILYDV